MLVVDHHLLRKRGFLINFRLIYLSFRNPDDSVCPSSADCPHGSFRFCDKVRRFWRFRVMPCHHLHREHSKRLFYAPNCQTMLARLHHQKLHKFRSKVTSFRLSDRRKRLGSELADKIDTSQLLFYELLYRSHFMLAERQPAGVLWLVAAQHMAGVLWSGVVAWVHYWRVVLSYLFNWLSHFSCLVLLNRILSQSQDELSNQNASRHTNPRQLREDLMSQGR